MSETVEFPVHGGMCRLRFEPFVATGRGSDTNPGIGFDLIATRPFMSPDQSGNFVAGTGVIARSDARLLMEMLAAFLSEAEQEPHRLAKEAS